jgi:signal transduction histidine kinase
VVLLFAGGSIMFFSTAIRPEPEMRFEFDMPNVTVNYTNLTDRIKSDRRDGDMRLLITLICVGVIIEVAVFWITHYLSGKIVKPVKDSYDKQKLFIANASHELKTPLAVIQANMEALEIEKGSEKWKENIETEITHANKLVLDLLQLAKMDAGDIQKSEREKVIVIDELKKRIEIFKPKFSGRISTKLSDKSEYLLVKQDFFQVVDILMDNAIKYGDKKITVLLEDGRLSLANDGTIIPEKETEKIFDRFYQVDKAREGSGLGLAIAKAVCERNGWQISCKNNKTTTEFVLDFKK